MNLKERGFTVGDLLLILFFVISTILIINKVKDSDKQVHFIKDHIENLASENS